MRFSPILFAVLMMVQCGWVAAQDISSVDVYDRDTIYIHRSILGDGFVRNGQIMGIGMFGSNLAEEMKGSRYALEEMERVRKYMIAGAITNVVATTFGITGIVLAFRDDDEGGRTFEITSIVIGAACGILTEGFNRAAMGAMNRAVWLYNRDIMSGRLRRMPPGERIITW